MHGAHLLTKPTSPVMPRIWAQLVVERGKALDAATAAVAAAAAELDELWPAEWAR